MNNTPKLHDHYPQRICPACKRKIGHGNAWGNHCQAHVRRGELVERIIKGKKVYLLPGEVEKAEG